MNALSPIYGQFCRPIFQCRRRRCRARRARRRLRPCGARPQGRAVRQESLARRQGGGAGAGRLPVRHGADHPDRSRRAGPGVLPRPGGGWRTTSTSGGSTRNGAVSSRTARCSTSRRTCRPWPASSPNMRPAASRVSPTSSPCPKGCTGVSEKFFFWKSVEGITDTLEFKGMNLATLRDVMSLRMGTSVAGQIRKRVPDGPGGADAGPFRAVCRQLALRLPGRAVQHRAHADAEGRVVSHGRHPRRAAGAGAAGGRAGRRPAARHGRSSRDPVRKRPRHSGVRTEAGETVRLSAVVSNMDSVRTYRELVGGKPAASFARRWKRDPACSGVVLYLGLDRRYEHLAHHDFVFSRDPEEEFDWIYGKGEPAPDPTCYVAAPSGTEPGVAPPGGRRCMSSSTRPISARITTGPRCSRPTAR